MRKRLWPASVVSASGVAGLNVDESGVVISTLVRCGHDSWMRAQVWLRPQAKDKWRRREMPYRSASDKGGQFFDNASTRLARHHT